MEKHSDRITLIPGLMGGKPTIRGNRFPVSDVLEMLQADMSRAQILHEHPILETEDIDACLQYANGEVNKNRASEY